MRGTTNRNVRGSSKDRRRRRAWLVATFNPELGPDTCCCCWCSVELTVDTVTVDRIVPGCHGGTYRRGNIRPACAKCNSETGGALRSKAA